MKKILFAIVVFGTFGFGLSNTLAMVNNDGNKNDIISDDMMSITTYGMTSPDENEVYNITNIEEDLYTITETEDDKYTTTSKDGIIEKTSADTLKTTSTDNKDGLLNNILYGVFGVVLGSSITAFIISKKK